MKFATLALVASASAIKLSTEAQDCKVPGWALKFAFNHIDTNHNGQLSESEGKAALAWLHKNEGVTLSASQLKWVEDTAVTWAGKGGPKNSMGRKEFAGFANQVVNHFGLCDELAKLEQEHSG